MVAAKKRDRASGAARAIAVETAGAVTDATARWAYEGEGTFASQDLQSSQDLQRGRTSKVNGGKRVRLFHRCAQRTLRVCRSGSSCIAAQAIGKSARRAM